MNSLHKLPMAEMEEYMAWCPKCKVEYVDGITECADCHTPLVNQLDESVVSEDEDFSLLSNSAKAAILENVRNTSNNISHSRPEDNSDAKPAYQRAYVSKAERLKDMKSTGYTFITIGIAGIIYLILETLDIVNILNRQGASEILFNTVMGALFVIFTFVGIHAFLSVSKLKNEAEAEDSLTKQASEYLASSVSAEDIDRDFDTSQPEEVLYFARIEKLSSILKAKYPTIDEGLCDTLVEDTYNKLFH